MRRAEHRLEWIRTVTRQDTPTRPAPRSKLRRALPLLLTAWLVLEIWLLVQVGSWLGGLTVVLLLIAGVLIGGSLIKRAARAPCRRPSSRPATRDRSSRRPGPA